MKAAASGTQQRNQPSSPAAPDFSKPPLKPHRKLFIFLCILFGLWACMLLTLFFTTVYPYRHSLTTTAPALP
jgi:hypothetical protein